MKFNIYSTEDYIEEILIQNLRKIKKSVITFFDYEAPKIEGDKIIFVCNNLEEVYFKNIDISKDVYILTTNLSMKTNRLKTLICKVKPLESILDGMWKNNIIPLRFNASVTENAINKFIELMLSNTFAPFNLINPGIINGQDVVTFYNFSQGINYIEEDITPYHHPELTNVDKKFLPIENKTVNIYIPVYYRFEKTKKCITSIRKTAEKSIHNIEIYIGDNNTKLENMKSWLENIPEKVYFCQKNIGKANIVNMMHKNARKSDYVFSIDGDMCCLNTEEYNIFDSMIDCLEKGENIGLISSFQYGKSEHWFNGTIYEKSSNNINLGFSKSGIGISGGCIVMRTKDWDQIGGYKENHDIYTGDDGILTYKVFRHLNKHCAISMDYGMIHPEPDEDEKGYVEWKQKRWKKDNLNFLKDDYYGSMDKGYYD